MIRNLKPRTCDNVSISSPCSDANAQLRNECDTPVSNNTRTQTPLIKIIAMTTLSTVDAFSTCGAYTLPLSTCGDPSVGRGTRGWLVEINVGVSSHLSWGRRNKRH